uniref:Ovule protein n=1 Tax=Haemonchus placei TaxID=6290 RepID=A0A0N4XAW4_HAEPC
LPKRRRQRRNSNRVIRKKMKRVKKRKMIKTKKKTKKRRMKSKMKKRRMERRKVKRRMERRKMKRRKMNPKRTRKKTLLLIKMPSWRFHLRNLSGNLKKASTLSQLLTTQKLVLQSNSNVLITSFTVSHPSWIS